MNDNRKKLCNIELEMLRSIDYVCKQLDLIYIIYAGTLLGAIRHKGFIPWDDDIDIVMPREDYEIFLKEGYKYLPDNLMIQHYSTEPETYNLWIKVRNKNTVFLEKDSKDFNICHGIFIDVFPFDKCKNGKINYLLEFFNRRKFNIIAGCYSENYIKSILSPVKRSMGKVINKLICKKVPISIFLEKEDNRRKKLNIKKNVYYPIHFFENKGTLSFDDLFDRKKFKFEVDEFYGPIKYDLILKKLYGDYMKIPSKDKQITHEPIKILFDIKRDDNN